VDEMGAVRLSFGWFPWRTILSAIFFSAVLGAGGYVVYQLWDEHQRRNVAETPGSGAEISGPRQRLSLEAQAVPPWRNRPSLGGAQGPRGKTTGAMLRKNCGAPRR